MYRIFSFSLVFCFFLLSLQSLVAMADCLTGILIRHYWTSGNIERFYAKKQLKMILIMLWTHSLRENVYSTPATCCSPDWIGPVSGWWPCHTACIDFDWWVDGWILSSQQLIKTTSGFCCIIPLHTNKVIHFHTYPDTPTNTQYNTFASPLFRLL